MLNKEVLITDERKKPLVIPHTTFRSSNDFLLTKDDLEKAQRELNETEEVKIKGLNELKESLSRERGLKWRMDNEYLLRYLRHGKFNSDRAKRAILNLYSLRKRYPDAFALTTRLEYLLNSGFYYYLPYTDGEGRTIFWIDIKKWNTEDISFNEMGQLMTAIWDVSSMNPSFQINGVIGIWDFKGVTIRHAAKVLYPSNLRLFLSAIQDSYPWRMKGLFLINCNSIVQKGYRVMQAFVKKKIADRIKFLGSDMSELHQYVNPAVLPKRCGGSLEDNDLCNTQHIMDNLPYLKYDRSFGYVSV